MRAVSGSVPIAALATLLLCPPALAASPCASYPATAARALKPRIEALRLIEREAADRLVGRDTRPFSYLAAQANATAGQIGEARAIADEDALECPDPVPHVRRLCASAALALSSMLDEQGRAAVTQISRQVYAQAMTICESLVGLPPLRTAFRVAD